MRLALLLLILSAAILPAQAIKMSNAQALEIGRRIWKNECAGTVSGLTSWNSGEDFASLGIGHFIWYPAGKRGPFEESFPGLMRYLAKNGVEVHPWMLGPCPWKTRTEFVKNFNSQSMVQLRNLLKNSISLQARYAAKRLENSLPKMLAAAPRGYRDKVKMNFYRVAAQPVGPYALMDYVNFKGEGTNPSERYKGEGWGLLQVLCTMPGAGTAIPAFCQGADQVLTQRVRNSPPARNEAKWLPGWRNRIKTYRQ